MKATCTPPQTAKAVAPASFTQSPDASPQTAKAVAQASCAQSPDALQTNATHTK